MDIRPPGLCRSRMLADIRLRGYPDDGRYADAQFCPLASSRYPDIIIDRHPDTGRYLDIGRHPYTGRYLEAQRYPDIGRYRPTRQSSLSAGLHHTI